MQKEQLDDISVTHVLHSMALVGSQSANCAPIFSLNFHQALDYPGDDFVFYPLALK